MKAQLFEAKTEKEIRLANGVQFFSEENETKETFIARVTEVIERDYVDTLELTEVGSDSFKKKNTKQLQKIRQTLTGVELRIVQEILVERGALEQHEGDGLVYNSTVTDDDIPAEGSKEHKKGLSKGSAKTEKTESASKEKKEKALKVEKEQKPLKKQLTEEETAIALSEAEKNKGHVIEFHCTKTKAMANGVIKGVRLDKRNNFIQYRILAEDGEMYGKGIDSEELKIGGLAPVEVKEPKTKKEKAPVAEEVPVLEPAEEFANANQE